MSLLQQLSGDQSILQQALKQLGLGVDKGAKVETLFDELQPTHAVAAHGTESDRFPHHDKPLTRTGDGRVEQLGGREGRGERGEGRGERGEGRGYRMIGLTHIIIINIDTTTPIQYGSQ